MSLREQILSPGELIYYTESFRNTLEDHIDYIRNDSSTRVVILEDIDKIKYQFDLYSLLLKLEVPIEHHWLTMRLNGLNASTDNIDHLNFLLIPNNEIINHIAALFKTGKKKKIRR